MSGTSDRDTSASEGGTEAMRTGAGEVDRLSVMRRWWITLRRDKSPYNGEAVFVHNRNPGTDDAGGDVVEVAPVEQLQGAVDHLRAVDKGWDEFMETDDMDAIVAAVGELRTFLRATGGQSDRQALDPSRDGSPADASGDVSSPEGGA